jgi:hypothetical protein
MLWFDDDPRRGILERIARAASYYAEKYGQAPTLCLLHPITAGEGLPERHDSLVLRTNPGVLRGHFWLGMEDAPTA